MSERRESFLSIGACIALCAGAGLLGIVLIRAIPISTDNDYQKRYAAWGRGVQEMFDACGKHEPRDPECVRRHPIGEKP